MRQQLLNLYLNTLNIKVQTPSLAFVKEIQEKHLATFSFNNIAVLLRDEISLDMENIIEKIVVKGLGGYCFEHNALMYEVLNSLGFDTRLLIGRVINKQNIETPRTHRVTLLLFKGKEYLVDVGFGSYCLREPIEVANISSCKTHRLIKEGKKYKLQLSVKNDFITLYEFDLDIYTQADCIMGNFYSSNYKDAVFMNNFVISLIKEDITLSLKNNTYHRIKKDATEEQSIECTEDLHKIINNDFGIALSIQQCKELQETGAIRSPS